MATGENKRRGYLLAMEDAPAKDEEKGDEDKDEKSEDDEPDFEALAEEAGFEDADAAVAFIKAVFKTCK